MTCWKSLTGNHQQAQTKLKKKKKSLKKSYPLLAKGQEKQQPAENFFSNICPTVAKNKENCTCTVRGADGVGAGLMVPSGGSEAGQVTPSFSKVMSVG